jgi:hypothetical protein
MRRTTLTCLVVVAPLVALLAACGGGSSAGSCHTLTAPTSGPGDTLDYFPAEVGRSWNYLRGSGGIVSLEVTGTQQVGSETAAVFLSTSAFTTPSVEWVAKRPWGAYLLDDGSADPALAGTFPELVLPFPVQPAATVELARCTSIDAGDLDGDGRSDRADVVETLTVVSSTESTTVPAGSFTDVAHVRKDLELTVRSTSSGSAFVTASMDDWYAPGVGRVRLQRTLDAGGTPSSDSFQLDSYALPGARLAPAASAPAAAPIAVRVVARPGAPDSLEAAAGRLADRLLGWPR